MKETLLIFGAGYTAKALSARLLAQGWRVIGTTRDKGKAAELGLMGIEPVLWPGESLAPAIDQATHILASIAPDEGGDPVLRAHWGEIAVAAPRIAWAGYLSTTGVYGDHRGGWVDEAMPLTPSTRRGVWRARAEEEWRALAAESGLRLHIFRLAGIYGPGRGPFEKVRGPEARLIVKPGQYMSRIHVEDIATVLEASMAHPDPGAAYNVCDDEPCPPEEVLVHAAHLLGIPVPPRVPYEEAEMTPLARSFYAESKKVRNDRIRRDLGVRLAYPTYREGLAALLASGEA